MKQHYFLLLILCVAAKMSMAQDMPRVRQTIDTLTSATMHGRGYTCQGDTKAAAYLKNRFQEMGLQALPPDYVCLQPFQFPVNTIHKTPSLKINDTALQPGKDFVAHAASPSGKGKVTVITLPSAIFSDSATAQAFFAQPLKGKAVIMQQQDQQRISQLPAPYQESLNQAKLHVLLQPNALLTTVAQTQLAVPTLQAREEAWPKNIQRLTFEVKARFIQKHRAQNVIAYIQGNSQSDAVLVFTAHYDHLGGQGKDVYFPGANDNASGTAMLLELAAHYSQPANRPAYSMAFIAFAAEEAGLLGSRYYTENPLFALDRINFLVNLDLLGTGSDGMMVVNGKIHEREFRLLHELNEAQQYLPQLKARGKAANSDHYPFSEKGVPAFFFYTLGGTAAYHNTQDYAAQLPLTKFEGVFKLIVDFATTLQQ